MALKQRCTGGTTSRSSTVCVRASVKPTVSGQTSRRAVVLSTLSSALLLAAGAAGAKPARLADVVAEKAALNEQQLAIMEYAMRQQETAVKAKAVSERQALQTEVAVVEDTISKKITEEKAAVVSAKAAGDVKKAEALVASEAKLEAQAEQVAVAAAKIDAKMSWAEIVEQAKLAAADQQLKKSAAL